jgi:hypothetical protein
MNDNGNSSKTDFTMISTNGVHIIYGEGVSGEAQTTKAMAFASWLAAAKAKAQTHPNVPKLARATDDRLSE